MYEDKGQNLGEMGRGILDNGLDVKCPPQAHEFEYLVPS